MITIEVPDWCRIDDHIFWYAPKVYGIDAWVRERIVGYAYRYGQPGFLHQATNCPLYFTPFSEFGKTVRLEKNNDQT